MCIIYVHHYQYVHCSTQQFTWQYYLTSDAATVAKANAMNTKTFIIMFVVCIVLAIQQVCLLILNLLNAARASGTLYVITFSLGIVSYFSGSNLKL